MSLITMAFWHEQSIIYHLSSQGQRSADAATDLGPHAARLNPARRHTARRRGERTCTRLAVREPREPALEVGDGVGGALAAVERLISVRAGQPHTLAATEALVMRGPLGRSCSHTWSMASEGRSLHLECPDPIHTGRPTALRILRIEKQSPAELQVVESGEALQSAERGGELGQYRNRSPR